jgi:very-short-patch-repair endonuclease
MKDCHKIFGKIRETLPLEGGGKGVGVKSVTGAARRLRKYSTDTEQYLWRHIRGRQMEGFKFRRQHPIGGYVVDFVNLENRLVVELDGSQHLNNPKDKIRDEWLKAEGYRVLRFWDNEVFNNIEGILNVIQAALLNPHPNPLPQGEREDNF